MEDQRNLLRMLISTDNHLGVWERDEIRKDDSFVVFEEVLRTAVDERVDMLLLGGDLFHENTPSRSTLVRAIRLLNKYCMGDRPVAVRVLSDQAANFVAGRVNYQDPDVNIALPVFTIHGNHDDPGGADNLSAVDILSTCKLVNYFGKHALGGSNTGRLTLSPVILEKGTTRVCLYGLGSVRDERLGRLFQTPGCVTWERPASDGVFDTDAYMSMFVLHQNRVQHGAGAKNTVQNRHIPPWMDLVVWGHEHECKPELEAIEGLEDRGERYVLQPGSSVATALSEGEAKPKHIMLLEIRGNNWRHISHALKTVRPYVWETVALRDAPGVTPDKPDTVSAFLEKKVQDMIKATTRDAAAAAAATAEVTGAPGPPAPILPLVRLRVDYTGFSTIHSQRFGQRFVGKVANPQDILLWAKAPQKRAPKAPAGELPEELADGRSSLRPEQLDQAKMEHLIARHLQEDLQILPERELGDALHNFVDKDEKSALAECIDAVLRDTQALTVPAAGASTANGGAAPYGDGGAATASGAAGDEADVDALLAAAVAARRARGPGPADSTGRRSSAPDLGAMRAGEAGDGLSDDDTMPPPPPRSAAAAPPRPSSSGLRQTKGKGKAAATPRSTQSNLDGFLTPASPSQRASTLSAGRGAKRGGRAAAPRGGKRSRQAIAEEEEDDDEEAGEVDLISSGEDEATAPPSKRARGGAGGGRASARPPRAAAATATRKRRAAGADDDEGAIPSVHEDIEELVTSEEEIEDSPAQVSRAGGRRHAAGSSQLTAGGGGGGGRRTQRGAATPVLGGTPSELYLDTDEEDTQPEGRAGAGFTSGAAAGAVAGGATAAGAVASGATAAGGAGGGRRKLPGSLGGGASSSLRGGSSGNQTTRKTQNSRSPGKKR